MAIPAVLLAGIWGYTATGLITDQTQIRDDTALAGSVGGPAHTVLTHLQDERRLTAAWQATRAESARAALEKARTSTDTAIEDFRRRSYSSLHGKDLEDRATGLNDALNKLSKNRSAIDRRTLSTAKVFQYYTDTISQGSRVIEAATRVDEGRFTPAADATTSLVQVTEMLSREDALLSSAIASGEMSDAAREQFAQYLAVQRHIHMTMLDADDLPGDQAGNYERLVGDPQWKSLTSIEDAVATGRGTALPKEADAWRPTFDAVEGDLHALSADSFKGIADDGSGRADVLLMQAILGSLAAVAALVATGVLLRRASRSQSARLSRLREQIEELGERRLPRILEELDQGVHAETEGPLPTAAPAPTRWSASASPSSAWGGSSRAPWCGRPAAGRAPRRSSRTSRAAPRPWSTA
ncbi:nitrate- and nitrite sensing domain-containing protein [Streptomyces sp. M19]